MGLFAVNVALAQVGETPDELIAIYKCKSIEKPEIRLECYDNAVERFEKADNDGEFVTVSKAKIQNVEREAFGFNIPSLSSINRIFGLKEKSEIDAVTAEIKDKNNYLFISFSGEEMGLLGSNYFSKNPTIDAESINYMINMDMVGRMKADSTLAVYGTGTSPIFKQTLKSNNFEDILFQK